MTGILNQTGGTVYTTGTAAEGNGIRLGHYPQARTTYNMMAGTLIVGADYDLGCATDGNGWFNMTGGEVYTKRVMLNERDSTGGYGRLTVAGGVLNVGSLTGSAISNSICADKAPYLVELGGGGGVIRAVTNIDIATDATLYGSGADAITFDTCEWTITLTNRLSGTGGFNKAGSGTLFLSGENTCTGATQVTGGRLLLDAAGTLTNSAVTLMSGAALDLGGVYRTMRGVGGDGTVSNGILKVTDTVMPGTNGVGTLTLATGQTVALGGTFLAGVRSDGACGCLHIEGGDLRLDGMTLSVVDPAQLVRGLSYTIITYTGSLTACFSAQDLPDPWHAVYDQPHKRVLLRSERGTLFFLR